VLPLLLAIAALWLPSAALAQGSACDQLKTTLAARIEATGVRGYSLEAVPASTSVPAGAKAIGNCEGGALKILYRRWGGASVAASAPVAAPEPPPPKRQPPAASPEPPAPVASLPTQKPVLVPSPAPEPAKVEPVRAREAEPVRRAEPAPPPAAPAASAEPSPETPPLAQRVSGFVATHWRWLLALLLVPLAAVGWAWRAHYLAYDRNGLPRGPRL
jgi:outer membrane biosynthesis protein TonB